MFYDGLAYDAATLLEVRPRQIVREGLVHLLRLRVLVDLVEAVGTFRAPVDFEQVEALTALFLRDSSASACMISRNSASISGLISTVTNTATLSPCATSTATLLDPHPITFLI